MHGKQAELNPDEEELTVVLELEPGHAQALPLDPETEREDMEELEEDPDKLEDEEPELEPEPLSAQKSSTAPEEPAEWLEDEPDNEADEWLEAEPDERLEEPKIWLKAELSWREREDSCERRLLSEGKWDPDDS